MACNCPLCRGVVLEMHITCITVPIPDKRSRRIAAERISPAKPIVAVGIPTRPPEKVVSEHVARMAMYLDAASN